MYMVGGIFITGILGTFCTMREWGDFWLSER